MSELVTRIIIRNDSTVNWGANSEEVLLKGELGIEFTESGEPKIKIGDGTKTWAQLSYYGGESGGSTPSGSALYEAVKQEEESDLDAISRVVASTPLNKNDIAIVKSEIENEITLSTAYIYNGTAWVALNGNVNAENVYFDKDLITTSQVGNITLTNGQATIAAAGKNLKQVFDTIFVKEKNPAITQPSVNLSSSQVGKAYEVGTKITPSYTASLNPGSYQYGPATGVTVSSWEVTNTTGENLTEASGSFSELTVTDSTNYTITAKANHTAGTTPKTNVGNDYAAGAIAAGSKSKTSGAITGFRKSFYGTRTDKTELNSAAIRGLAQSSTNALANGAKLTITIPTGAMRVVLAYPATLRDVTSIQDVNGLNAEIKSSFTKTTVTVEGANAASAIDYKVYYLDYANANDTANTYSVTI